MCEKCDQMLDGIKAFRAGDKAPKDGPGAMIFNALDKAASLPKPKPAEPGEPGEPGSLVPHEHEGGRTGGVAT